MKKILFLLLFSFLYAGETNETNYTIILWIITSIIGLTGAILFFIYSKKTKELLEKQEEIVDKQIELDKNQANFLMNLSEDIQELIKENMIEKSKKNNEEIKNTKILDITNNLIEFLQLKSNKLEIKHEKFNLNNVLNEVSGYIASAFPQSNVDLIFDIENNVPSYIIGDASNLEKILINFLEFTFNNFDFEKKNEVKVEITKYSSADNNIELNFNITDNGNGLTYEERQTLYDPIYDDETDTYSGLGMFVAKEIISLIGGQVSTVSIKGKGTTFNISLPFETNNKLKEFKFKLSENIGTKNILLVDINYNSSLAIKKMLTYFKFDVKILTKDEFLENMINLSVFDIVILNESFFNINLIDYLYRLKSKSDLKVISIHSLFRKDLSSSLSSIIDNTLSSPLTQERIFELIVDLYEPTKKIEIEKKVEDDTLKVYKEDIYEFDDITQDSFYDFRGMKLLLVEDNLINQKVISNVLSTSEIEINIANNGEKALELLEQKDFDFVLMDINMPIMDGYEATKLIRSYSRYDKLPIIAFTALALVNERDKIFNLGMNGYLTKPIEIGKLYHAFSLFYTPEKREERERINNKFKEKTIPTNILDFNIGRAYSGNNCAFYSEILREFLNVYSKTNLTIEKLVREQKYEELEKLTLDLKGLTSYIGARNMFKLVFKIHEDIKKDNYKSLVNYANEYQKEFTKLEKSIKEYLE